MGYNKPHNKGSDNPKQLGSCSLLTWISSVNYFKWWDVLSNTTCFFIEQFQYSIVKPPPRPIIGISIVQIYSNQNIRIVQSPKTCDISICPTWKSSHHQLFKFTQPFTRGHLHRYLNDDTRLEVGVLLPFLILQNESVDKGGPGSVFFKWRWLTSRHLIYIKRIWWRTVDFQSTDVERHTHTHTHQITKNPIDICYFARDFNIKLLQIIPMIFHLLDSVCHQKFLKTIVFLTCSTEPWQLTVFHTTKSHLDLTIVNLKFASREMRTPNQQWPQDPPLKPTPLKTTPPKFNIAPEKLPSQKVSSLPTIHFQGLC